MSNVIHIEHVSRMPYVSMAKDRSEPSELSAFVITAFGNREPTFEVAVPAARRFNPGLTEYQEKLHRTSWLVRCDISDTKALIDELINILDSVAVAIRKDEQPDMTTYTVDPERGYFE